MKKKFSKIGGHSYGVIISKKILDILGFDVNKEFEMAIENGKIIISPIKENDTSAKEE